MVRLPDASAINTYMLDEQFVQALKRVRTALENAHLAIAGELDLAARIRKTLRISVPPCVVLFAAYPEWTTQEYWDLGSTVGTLIPLHIVVSARGDWTEVHFLRSLPTLNEVLHRSVLAKLGALQAAVSLVVEKIGMRNLDI